MFKKALETTLTPATAGAITGELEYWDAVQAQEDGDRTAILPTTSLSSLPSPDKHATHVDDVQILSSMGYKQDLVSTGISPTFTLARLDTARLERVQSLRLHFLV